MNKIIRMQLNSLRILCSWSATLDYLKRLLWWIFLGGEPSPVPPQPFRRGQDKAQGGRLAECCSTLWGQYNIKVDNKKKYICGKPVLWIRIHTCKYKIKYCRGKRCEIEDMNLPSDTRLIWQKKFFRWHYCIF